ncbi:lytic murein transglycosylase [Mesorhizobium sp. M8A.F.Ca.ET.023.01.1.1]|nr:lytic murein transglycosylase [Mesorhizobium sp. M8A.F.Ca.ET.023.01.1.1]
MPTVAFLRAPLCPAGHLPHEGGDRMSSRLSPISNVAGLSEAPRLLISPLVGEMSDRTEGGAVPPTLETEAR